MEDGKIGERKSNLFCVLAKKMMRQTELSAVFSAKFVPISTNKHLSSFRCLICRTKSNDNDDWTKERREKERKKSVR